MINKMLKEIGISELLARFRINDYHAIKETVQAGLGVAILPHFTVENELIDQTLCKLNVTNPCLYLTVMLLERPRQSSSAAVTAVKSFLETNLSVVTPNRVSTSRPPEQASANIRADIERLGKVVTASTARID